MIQKISQLIPNPDNPRFIKDDKFKKLVQSIKDFPEMLKFREKRASGSQEITKNVEKDWEKCRKA